MMGLFACLSPCLEPTPWRQLGRAIEAMLARSGRGTRRGLSRWAGKGGRYRPLQRFCTTRLHGGHLPWLLLRPSLLDADEGVVRRGDEGVGTKAGTTPSG